ncbi:hypothetical protein GCM10020221_06070 [Streptomyces thioluteus]|uniref:Uncharacterized protein n=1 Tax=Streptomyces thioluteus TaxID=66431 RepID=A0ABN3WG32_STRTU
MARQAADELLLVEELDAAGAVDEEVLEEAVEDDVVVDADFAGLLLDEVPRLSLR